MKFYIHLALSLLVISVASAQERTASGALDVQMTWSALSAKIKSVSDKTEVMGAQVTQLVECNKKGMLYAPGQPGIDGQGCKSVSMPNPATLNITPRTQTLCTRGGTHTVISSCAGGERLLGCGGGAGDMDSSHEYWVLMPEFQNNRCVGYIGNPACYGAYYSQAMVTAICYTP